MAIIIVSYSEVLSVVEREEPSKAHFTKVLSVSRFLDGPATFVYQTLTLYLPVNYLTSL